MHHAIKDDIREPVRPTGISASKHRSKTSLSFSMNYLCVACNPISVASFSRKRVAAVTGKFSDANFSEFLEHCSLFFIFSSVK